MAGCAVAPTTEQTDQRAAFVLPEAEPPQNVDFLPLRVSVEYLPPRETNSFAAQLGGPEARDEVRVRSLRPPKISTPHTHYETPDKPRQLSPFLLDEKLIAEIEDPAERYTMSFVNDLVGEDRRRMQREIQTPIFTNRLNFRMNDTLRTSFDDLQEEEDATHLNRVVPGMLRRPLRDLLKRITEFDKLEVAFDEFKARNIPTSKAHEQQNGGTSWGRVSMRLKTTDRGRGTELSYYNWGWRIGSSQDHGRLQYRFQLGESINGSVNYEFEYETHDVAIRADLRYEIDDRTQMSVLLGDTLFYLGGPTEYSAVDSPLDGASGVLFYVEHLF